MRVIDGDRVRERRVAAGLSQPELAALITNAGFGPLSYQAIQQLEEGGVKRPKYAMYLAGTLNTSWEYLTGQTDNPAAPNDSRPNETLKFLGSNGPTHPQGGVGQEGPHMLIEISKMLGVMEGSLKTAFGARFDAIDKKLDNHERRLEALEDRPLSGPQKGRRR